MVLYHITELATEILRHCFSSPYVVGYISLALKPETEDKRLW